MIFHDVVGSEDFPLGVWEGNQASPGVPGRSTIIPAKTDRSEGFWVKTYLKRRFRGVALTSQSMCSPSTF